jgi:hypothetical protein
MTGEEKKNKDKTEKENGRADKPVGYPMEA